MRKFSIEIHVEGENLIKAQSDGFAQQRARTEEDERTKIKIGFFMRKRLEDFS